MFLLTTLACLLLCIRLAFFRSNVRKSAEEDRLNLEQPVFKTRPTQHDMRDEELVLAKRYVCGNTALQDGIDRLMMCGSFSKRQKMIGALLEVRNAAMTIDEQLRTLLPTVDAIIVLDDHSTDETRSKILSFNRRHRTHAVHVLLNKTATWKRQELLHRNALLHAARHVGVTHFVMLDYDEILSANCAHSLRTQILALAPGESLFIPWVELWKTPYLHRVHPDDATINFLTRRQIIIFADDGTFVYTMENSGAHMLRAEDKSSLHVLRCPRIICKQPHRYVPRHGYGVVGRVAEKCRILEMRFLSLSNVMLKAAWYEAVGRVAGARDGVTSGKMISRTFAVDAHTVEDIRVDRMKREWLPDFDWDAFRRVETWRTEELLQWIDDRGESFFGGLPVLTKIDLKALRRAVVNANGADLRHVPMKRIGDVVVCVERASHRVMTRFMRLLGWQELSLEDISRKWEEGVIVGEDTEAELKYELFRADIEREIKKKLKLGNGRVFISCSGMATHFAEALLQVLTAELAYLNITFVFADWVVNDVIADAEQSSALYNNVRRIACQAGSHVRMMDVPLQSFGSYAMLQWLRRRLISYKTEQDQDFLDFAEGLHSVMGGGVEYTPTARVVFSLNVGRSGSKYFADVVASVEDLVVALHEPNCNHGECSGGGAMRMQNISLTESYSRRKNIKVPMIRHAIAGLSRGNRKDFSTSRTVPCDTLHRTFARGDYRPENIEHFRPVYEADGLRGCSVHSVKDFVYVETNPNFKSWFYDVVLEYFSNKGYDVRVIVIRKYVAAVLKSLYETGYFSKRDGYKWMETSSSVNSRVTAAGLRNDDALDAYEKLLSYVVNSEAVFRNITRTYGLKRTTEASRNTAKFLQVRAEKLYTAAGAKEVLRWVGLKCSTHTQEILGVVRDKYREGGKRKHAKTSLAECEKRVRMFAEKFGGDNGESDVAKLLASMGKDDSFEYPP